MASLSYGPFTIREQDMRTMDFSITPVLDNSGLDVLYHKVVISCSAIINPSAFASNQIIGPIPGAPPTWSTVAIPGDRAGLTMRQVELSMGNPQQLLQYYVGPDLVLKAPNRLDPAGLSYLPCDPAGGPRVHRCKIMDPAGDKTALLLFTVEAAVTGCSKWLLSNRWRMTSEIDSAGWTTRTTVGEARFRLDFLAASGELFPTNADADDFRPLIVLPTADDSIGDMGLKRMSVRVNANDRGDVIQWSVVDRQTLLGLGINSGIEKITGAATVGIGRSLPDMKEVIEMGVGVAPELLTVGGRIMAAVKGIKKIWNDAVYHPRGNCTVRVTGMAGTPKSKLCTIAFGVITDRFNPIGGSFAYQNLSVTQSISTEQDNWIEMRATIVPFGFGTLASMFDASSAPTMMKMDDNINTGGNIATTALPRTQLPFSNNSRGSYLGGLFGQALLSSPCSLVPAPPAAPVRIDITASI